MIFGIIVVGLILLFLILFSLFTMSDGGSDFGTGLITGLFIALLSVVEITMILDISIKPKPRAIDVYRNKTELEITSVNGTPRDTVVVWKEGIE